MEKLFLKPTSQELVIKGNDKEGHTDVFTYDYYDDDSKRKLGSLFIVGNIKDDAETDDKTSPDIAYVVNLVASLAKREYYSKPEISARDAFSATLKKINDVVEEFFKNRVLKLNIGIFAIADEQILISKLGKFKIILRRDGKIVDILNNIDLFNKERANERSFSNIISGKVASNDKLFAFYPSRLVTAREKTIRADLLKLNDDQFLEKINSIKKTKPDFDCGALFLSLNKHKKLTAPEKIKLPVAGPNSEPKETYVSLAKVDENIKKPAADIKEKQASTEPDHALPPVEPPAETPNEVPKIISSEFSLGKKSNPLLVPLKIIKNLYSGPATYTASLAKLKPSKNKNFKRRAIILSIIVFLSAAGVLVFKKFIAVGPEQRQLNKTASQVRNNLELVQTKINQNDFIGARQLLAESLSNIYGLNIANDKTKKTINEIYELLDKLDNPIEASPSLLEIMPPEISQKISLIAAQGDKLNTNEYGITSPVTFDVYENNLYVLASNNILKVADISQNDKKSASSWLKSGTLPSQASLIVVDGKIYVIGKSGVLATYYKGEKASEVNTSIVSNNNDILLTSKDSDKLYLVNKLFTRIYELDKNSGSLTRTVKIISSEPFADAYLFGDNTIIIMTKDGRIWEVK